MTGQGELGPLREHRVRVLLVDDAAFVREGFRMVLDPEPGIEVVGEAADGVSGAAEAERLRPDGEYLLEALDAGVSGFALKDTPPEILLAGILAVARDDALVEPETTVRVIARSPRKGSAIDVAPAERAPLDLVAAGLSDAEIAPRLGLDEMTVGEQVAALRATLGVRDRIHAVLAAHRSS